ncbi:hypothetical protein NP493_592g01007 [Ridgeia piscesae]|uniref:Phosphodiesterase n=1 Tax=Ridgeia piscesae TaxID=27915 RepID=A0AAD9NR23_RIDPI|nr:hypothetical protein NP493_592g01007 [Ridgeia piscesae]
MNISHRLAANNPHSRYELNVVGAYYNASVPADIGCDIKAIEDRLERLERVVIVETGTVPAIVHELKQSVERFKEKLENVDHLSWLGLYKDISAGTSLQPFWDKQSLAGKRTAEHKRRVYEKFLRMSEIQVTDHVREYVRQPTFDNWQWDEPEMLVLLRQMFLDLHLTTTFSIELPVLQRWLYEVYCHYNHVPFHNFQHCFMVTQMMYGLTWLMDLQSHLDDTDLLILLTAAICHDLDHPGYTNAYQINARTELALRYNDISPLENHHCSVAFELLERPEMNIFHNLSTQQYKVVREGIIKCILATDMSKHSEILSTYKSLLPSFDFSNKDHKTVLLMVLVKVADISNEVRPLQVAEPWLDCLLQEFFMQSDVEKLEGLPVAPFMDREKVTKPSSQVGFIKFVLLPLFEALGDQFPAITEDIILPVRHALQYYSDMQNALDEEKKRKASLEAKNNVK